MSRRRCLARSITAVLLIGILFTQIGCGGKSDKGESAKQVSTIVTLSDLAKGEFCGTYEGARICLKVETPQNGSSWAHMSFNDEWSDVAIIQATESVFVVSAEEGKDSGLFLLKGQDHDTLLMTGLFRVGDIENLIDDDERVELIRSN